MFLAWWAAATRDLRIAVLEDAGFLVVAIALILASATEFRRKLLFTLGLVGVFALFDTVALLTGLRALVEDPGASGDLPSELGRAVFHAFRLGLPIAGVLFFAGARVSSLWEGPESSREPVGACPICGKKRVGLEAHVRDAHGPKELKRLQRDGLL